MTWQILAPHDSVTVEHVRAAIASAGWTLQEDNPREHWTCRTLIWSDGDTELVYVEEHMWAVRFVFVSGPRQHEVCAELTAALPVDSTDALLEQAMGSPDPLNLIRTARKLSRLVDVRPTASVGQDNPRSRYLAVWNRLLSHPEKTVRRVAIASALTLPWQEVDDLLRARLDIDAELASPLENLLAARAEHLTAGSG